MDNKSIDPSNNKVALVKVETKSLASDISTLIDPSNIINALDKRVADAKSSEESSEECSAAMEARRQALVFAKEIRQLNYLQQVSDFQLQQAKQKAISQNWQQIGAIVASIAIGIFLFPTSQLGGLLFLILGLAKPLGYSLVEVANLFDSLRGFPKDLGEITLDGSEQINKDEEPKNARP
jgi:hypothetical protein